MPVALLVLTLGSAATALALVSVSARRTYRTLERAAAQRQTAYEFLMALRLTRQHVGEVRVGLTGYVFARDSQYKATYTSGMTGLSTDTTTLRRLAQGQPTLQPELDRLGALITTYATVMASTMQAAERRPQSAVGPALHQARSAILTEGFRSVIAAVEQEQSRLMALRAAEVTAAVRQSNALITWSLGVGIVIVLGAGGVAFAWLWGREMERQLRTYAERLAENGRQLEAANKELDSFAHSVSHDLRAPLRAVDGFVRLLIEEHGGQLDEAGRQLGARVRAAAKDMSRLIDDLLAFSRLGRTPLRRGRLDMDALVRSVIADLKALEPHRAIEFRVTLLPPALGDSSLIRQVWVNLLGNAVKYTRPRAQALIEVTAAASDGQVVYSVKDNGVGFNMAYADNLFGVFQRLHAASDFEGTGVGLALVQRIVHRHGGTIWAEGKPDAGATFSFTLPTTEGH